MKKFVSQKELPESERPYEKCERFGPGVLSDAELLAVIIRTGTKELSATGLATKILSLPGRANGLSGLHHYSVYELKKIKGIGRVKAVQLVCVAELSKRIAEESRERTASFLSPADIAAAYMERMRHLETEEIILLMLNTKMQKIADCVVFKGTVSSAIFEPREILMTALRYDAVNIVLLHNHPSGNPTPSTEDVNATKKLSLACDLVGLSLRDHIVIGDHCFISMKERGFLEKH